MTDSRPPNSASWREAASLGGSLEPARFRAALLTKFPEILTDLARVGPHDLHEQARCLGRHAVRSIALCNEAAVRKVFEFISDALDQASPEVHNALNVSLLEPLALPQNEVDRRWALALMPDSLEVAWRNAHELRQRMLGDSI